MSSHSSSSTSASGSWPMLQYTISTMIFRSSSEHRVAGGGHGAIDHDLAQRGGSTPARFEEADEAQALRAQVVLLGHRVHAHAVARLGWAAAWCDGCIELGALRRDVQAVEPDQRLLDFVRLEALGAELASELLQFGARIAAPVVFVDEHQHFEHGDQYSPEPHRCGARGPGCCACTSPAKVRSDGFDALEQAAGQARDAALQVRVRAAGPAAQPPTMPVRATSASRLTGSKPIARSSGPSACGARGSAAVAAPRREFLQHVLRGLDQLGALLEQARGSRVPAANGSSPGSRTRPCPVRPPAGP